MFIAPTLRASDALLKATCRGSISRLYRMIRSIDCYWARETTGFESRHSRRLGSTIATQILPELSIAIMRQRNLSPDLVAAVLAELWEDRRQASSGTTSPMMTMSRERMPSLKMPTPKFICRFARSLLAIPSLVFQGLSRRHRATDRIDPFNNARSSWKDLILKTMRPPQSGESE